VAQIKAMMDAARRPKVATPAPAPVAAPAAPAAGTLHKPADKKPSEKKAPVEKKEEKKAAPVADKKRLNLQMFLQLGKKTRKNAALVV